MAAEIFFVKMAAKDGRLPSLAAQNPRAPEAIDVVQIGIGFSVEQASDGIKKVRLPQQDSANSPHVVGIDPVVVTCARFKVSDRRSAGNHLM